MRSTSTLAQVFRGLIIGPPGSGKGTVSSRIVNKYKVRVLSSGDMLRSHISQQSDLGKLAKKYIDKGKLLPDDLMTNLVMDEVNSFKNYNWLLDGFPRTLPQAKSLNQKISLTNVIVLDVPDRVIISRVEGRLVHLPSGRTYNSGFNPPKVPGKDDVTGEDLVQRDDDKPETVQARLTSYRNETSPVVEFYKSLNILQEFTGTKTDEIWPLIVTHLDEIFIPKK